MIDLNPPTNRIIELDPGTKKGIRIKRTKGNGGSKV